MPVVHDVEDDACDRCDEPPTDDVERHSFSVATLPTETPAPHRAYVTATPTPLPDSNPLDPIERQQRPVPYPPPLPPPRDDRHEPLRVHVARIPPPEERLGAVTSTGVAEPLLSPVPLFDGVPDHQRLMWSLDQALDRLTEIQRHTQQLAVQVETGTRLLSETRQLHEQIEARTAGLVRDDTERKRAEIAAWAARRGQWDDWLRKESGKVFALLTFVLGAGFAVVAKRTGIAPEWVIDLISVLTGVK